MQINIKDSGLGKWRESETDNWTLGQVEPESGFFDTINKAFGTIVSGVTQYQLNRQAIQAGQPLPVTGTTQGMIAPDNTTRNVVLVVGASIAGLLLFKAMSRR